MSNDLLAYRQSYIFKQNNKTGRGVKLILAPESEELLGKKLQRLGILGCRSNGVSQGFSDTFARGVFFITLRGDSAEFSAL